MNVLQFFVLCSFVVLGTSRAFYHQEEEASISAISNDYAKYIVNGIKDRLRNMYNLNLQFAVLCLIPQDGQTYKFQKLLGENFCHFSTDTSQSHTEEKLLKDQLPGLMTAYKNYFDIKKDHFDNLLYSLNTPCGACGKLIVEEFNNIHQDVAVDEFLIIYKQLYQHPHYYPPFNDPTGLKNLQHLEYTIKNFNAHQSLGRRIVLKSEADLI